MTHQRLREKAEAVIAAREEWRRPELQPSGLEAWSKLNQARDSLANEADPETILALLAELDAARKDAERWVGLKDELSKGNANLPFLLFYKLDTSAWDDAIDAALNADGEKGE